jgi:hypothetical protein
LAFGSFFKQNAKIVYYNGVIFKMSTSTDGQICYGILFEEDFEFPWSEFDDDIEDWWRHINNYENPNPSPFDEKGYYLPGIKRDSLEITKYFDHSREWDEKNPIPIKIVNYCSANEPMIILAVKRTVLTANRGYSTSFNPSSLVVSSEEREELLEFCEKYIGKVPESPRWWLSSYWG